MVETMTETQPLFSVVIPTYNRSNAVVKAVQSVLAQTYIHFEVIVVDDGSTDDTSSEIENLARNDNRVIYVFQENQERSASRNNGVALAKGAFICFLDSDDLYEPDHLFLLKKTIDQGEETAALYHVNGKLKAGEKNYSDYIPETHRWRKYARIRFIEGDYPDKFRLHLQINSSRTSV